mmetsp:Transcript_22790/g.34523  ORF Transcript_22790/g.34523 Transcript_22790/m.34523 type:complete len:206 (+) Transcript_22790:318-935(+)
MPLLLLWCGLWTDQFAHLQLAGVNFDHPIDINSRPIPSTCPKPTTLTISCDDELDLLNPEGIKEGNNAEAAVSIALPINTSLSPTNASYNAGAAFLTSFISAIVVSFVFSRSTNIENSSGDNSLVCCPLSFICLSHSCSSGTRSFILSVMISSASANFFRSVSKNKAFAIRFRVTSIGLSPRMMMELLLTPASTEVTNSSPGVIP